MSAYMLSNFVIPKNVTKDVTVCIRFDKLLRYNKEIKPMVIPIIT
jgi:hypothetical protein